ncbi:MAG: nuclear transport factor 2 family protein [Actinomycetota bacterium]
MAHPNETLLREGIAAFQAGDMDKLKTFMAEDIVLHVPGTNKLSGDYKGQGEVLGTFFPTIMQLTGGDFKLDRHDSLANDEHGIGVYDMHAGRDGKTFEWNQVNVYHLKNGKFAEAWVNIHQFEAWNKFFS